MFKYLYNLIFPSEAEKINKEIAKKYQEAIEYQRNGNIRGYSILMKDIANLEDRLMEIQK
tara:strand:+ start:221 stop:400 length:180 start_codon:yes stop_codon:yes gene_type:complete